MNTSSHFRFNRSQRNGMFFLILFILTIQLTYFFVNQLSGAKDQEWLIAESKLDSLKGLKQDVVNKIFKFNPNYLDDFRGYSFGMNPVELDRLYTYRGQGLYVNSIDEFKEVTQISDTILERMSPYFRFPEFRAYYSPVTNDNLSRKEKKVENKLDVNKASTEELIKVRGVGKVLSERILKYRSLLGGFVEMDQLYNVYGLDSLVVDRVFQRFKVEDLSMIRKINVNEASLSELVSNVYIDEDFATEIIVYRTKNGKIGTLTELTKIQGFPADKINLIQVYLTIE